MSHQPQPPAGPGKAKVSATDGFLKNSAKLAGAFRRQAKGDWGQPRSGLLSTLCKPIWFTQATIYGVNAERAHCGPAVPDAFQRWSRKGLVSHHKEDRDNWTQSNQESSLGWDGNHTGHSHRMTEPGGWQYNYLSSLQGPPGLLRGLGRRTPLYGGSPFPGMDGSLGGYPGRVQLAWSFSRGPSGLSPLSSGA